MKIVLSIADLQPESGGPSRSVSALATALADLGTEVELLALKYGGKRSAPLVPPAQVRTTLVPCRGALENKFRHTPEFKVALRKACKGPKPTLLHDNGLWLPTNNTAAQIARDMHLPFMISTRGMLTPWAMRFHGFKKRLAWQLYQHRNLETAKVLHATSTQEANELRALGLTQPVAVIPNGVSLPPEIHNSDTYFPPSSTPSSSGIRTALFLSRVHPKKGLLDLVAAWNEVKPVGWRAVIAGGDENGHTAEVKSAIAKWKLEKEFTFAGQIADDAKWGLYRSADLFVLPTHSENFGIVIAEALACRLPVITTRGTPWEELKQRHCGWWTEIGAQPLAQALHEAVQLSDEERRAMGRRGRQLVEENYTWAAAAKKMNSVYQWLLHLSDKPEYVD